MICPSCSRTLSPVSLLVVSASKTFTCPNCQKQSTKSSSIGWVVFGVLLLVDRVVDHFLNYLNFDASDRFYISFVVAIPVALLIEHFFQELTLKQPEV